MNLGTIRRYYVEKWSGMIKEKTSAKNKKNEAEQIEEK